MDATDYPPREFLFEQRFAKIEIIVGIILLLVGVYQAVSLYRKDMVFALASLVAGCAAAVIFLMTFFRQPRRLTLDEQGLRVSYPAKKVDIIPWDTIGELVVVDDGGVPCIGLSAEARPEECLCVPPGYQTNEFAILLNSYRECYAPRQ